MKNPSIINNYPIISQKKKSSNHKTYLEFHQIISIIFPEFNQRKTNLTTHKGLGEDEVFIDTVVGNELLHRIKVMTIDSCIESPHNTGPRKQYGLITTITISFITLSGCYWFCNGGSWVLWGR